MVADELLPYAGIRRFNQLLENNFSSVSYSKERVDDFVSSISPGSTAMKSFRKGRPLIAKGSEADLPGQMRRCPLARAKPARDVCSGELSVPMSGPKGTADVLAAPSDSLPIAKKRQSAQLQSDGFPRIAPLISGPKETGHGASPWRIRDPGGPRSIGLEIRTTSQAMPQLPADRTWRPLHPFPL